MAHHHQCHLHYLNNSAGWTNHVVMLFVNRRQHEQPRLRNFGVINLGIINWGMIVLVIVSIMMLIPQLKKIDYSQAHQAKASV